MNSLPPADCSSIKHDAEAASAQRDPYEVLDDLLVVMDGLCPVWPDKNIPRVTVGYLL